MVGISDFVTIQPIEPDLAGLKGLPQCHWAKEFCKRNARWTIEAVPYCTFHKDQIVQKWGGMIQDLVSRPEQASDGDLELLELVREEFGRSEIYPHVAVSPG